MAQEKNFKPYTVGDTDNRNWGSYVVTDVEYDGNDCVRCEKDITVKSGYMLSIQAHDHREELWSVKTGTLTVILNGDILDLDEGQDIHIPKGAVHAMVNRSEQNCIIHEIQSGLCDENDNHRYWDANNRPVETSTDINVLKSVEAGKNIAKNLEQHK